MIICKDRAILLFLLLIIYLDEAGANRKRINRKEICKETGEILDNGSFTSMNERKRKYVCQSDFVSNIPDLEKLTFKCKFERKSDSYEWKAKLTRVDTIYLRNVTCERMCTDVNGNMSIDEKLAGNNGYKEYIGDREFTLIELDMIVDKSNKRPSRPERYRATFDKDETKRWQIDVPYEISDGIGDLQELEIRRSISIWEQYSCLNFYGNKQVYNRLVFQLGEDNFCGSDVGMKQGPQIIYLGKNCFEPEIIVHEIGHALGFYHEHNRWDRDNYIKIHFENINPGYNESFIKRKPEIADFDHDYDYLSIMHYGQYFFSKNASAKLITIETKNPNFQSRIGKAKLPSFQDYKTLNDMYKCKDVCAKVECPEGGFLGKHCQCYCKGNPDGSPVRLCFQREECPKPFVNKYLFDVMNRDNTTLINMTRASFPDKTILNLFSTNWNCTIASQLICEGGKWTQTNAECPVALDIKMMVETGGVVEVKLNDVHRGYICDDDWDDNDATVACKMLGYTKGWANFQKPQEVNKSLPILLDNVQCRGEELSLADCKHNGWGSHDCEYSEVVSVKCFNDAFTNHIDNTHCGKIKLNDSKRKKRQLKVAGGFETIKGMHPWQVEIQRKKRGWIHWCGGTIINNEWILSAAHCFDDLIGNYDGLNAKLNFKDVRVIVGDHDLTIHDEYEEMFHIEYIVKHWNYSESERKYSNNDIALLKIKSTSGISFNDYIQPACLPEEFTQLSSETKCEVSGWGKENENGTITDTLRAAEVMIIPEQDCQGFYNTYSIDFKKVICAGNGIADTCQGDSGGPLICEINGQSTVIGITSWGKGCSQHEAPGVYTKVSEYVRWVNYQISNHRLEEVTMMCSQRRPFPDSIFRYFYNVETKRCEEIKYGGCDGNKNFYETEVSCRRQCRAELPKATNTRTEARAIQECICIDNMECTRDNTEKCIHGKYCDTNICQNGGTCIQTSSEEKCYCPKGFKGDDCSQRDGEFANKITFINAPVDRTLKRGQGHIEECLVEVPYEEEVVYSWSLQGTLINPYNNAIGFGTHPGGILQIDKFSDEMEGQYSCIATTSVETVNHTFTYTIAEDCDVRIYPGPQSEIKKLNEIALLTCRVNHRVKEVRWKKDGVYIDYNKDDRIKKMANNYLLISNVLTSDAGVYQCEAEDYNGCYSSKEGKLQVVNVKSHGKYCGISTHDEDLMISSRISKGSEAFPGANPWHVTIRSKGGAGRKIAFCGGTLISQRFVITAASCIIDFNSEYGVPFSAENVEILLGTTDCTGTQNDGTRRTIRSFTVHPDYGDRHVYDNDIALIELDGLVQYTDDIRPICLETADYNDRVFLEMSVSLSGIFGTVASCGVIKRYRFPSRLREVHIQYVYRERCLDSLGHTRDKLTDTMFCAGSNTYRTGYTCLGDSGSGLIMTTSKRRVLTGVVSWGRGCDVDKYYGIYTNVGMFYDWIESVTKFNEEEVLDFIKHN